MRNKANFHLQESICAFESPIKSYEQNSDRMFENIKEIVPR